MCLPLASNLLLATSLSLQAGAGEMRALWVVRTALVSPQEVDQVVDRAAEAGFNALLVQVRGRGDAFYESKLVPRSPLLSRQRADFDPLARLLLETERADGVETLAHLSSAGVPYRRLLTALFDVAAAHCGAHHSLFVLDAVMLCAVLYWISLCVRRPRA